MSDNKAQEIKTDNTIAETKNVFTEMFKNAIRKNEENQVKREEIDRELSTKSINLKEFGTSQKDYAARFLCECGPMSMHPVKYYTGKGWAVYNGIKWVTYDTIRDSEDAIKSLIYQSMDRFKFETLPAAVQLYKDKVRFGDKSAETTLDALEHIKPRPQDKSVIQGIIYNATGIEGIKVDAIEWDKPNPDIPETIYTINTPAGLYDLRTGKLYGLDPNQPTNNLSPSELLITKCTAVAPSEDYHYTENGDCVWLNFVHSIFPDPDVLLYAQKFFGYCLLGQKNKDLFVILYGTGGNGKTLLTNTINHALGMDYVANMTTKAITSTYSKYGNSSGTKESPHPSIVALKGARLGMMSELGDNDVLDVETLKKLTGGGIITDRDLNKSNISFEPTHQLMLDSNFPPRITNPNDPAIWRRIIMIPFIVDFTSSDKADPDLKTKLLRTEVLQDCLRWMIDGAVMCIAWGLPGPLDPDLPKPMQQLLMDYRRDVDYVGQWIAEKCVIGKAEAANTSDLYDNFGTWYRDNISDNVPSKIKFGKLLDKRKAVDYDGRLIVIRRDRNAKGGGRCYRGIGIRP